MSDEHLEQEISQLASQLKQLRLPHKLNQYRAYENKILSLKKKVENKCQLNAQLEQLQSQLDSSVLCGVSECFLCGGRQNGAASGQASIYNRSISAGSSYHRTTPMSQNGISSAKYGKQVSCIEQSSKKENLADLKVQPDIVFSPILPMRPVDKKVFFSSGHPEKISRAGKSETVTDTSSSGSKEEGETDVIQKESETNSNEQMRSTKFESDLSTFSINKAATTSNGKIEQVAEPTAVLSTVSPKLARQPLGAPSPYRTTPSSYRAYKDFINHYSSDRSKTNETDKKAV